MHKRRVVLVSGDPFLCSPPTGGFFVAARVGDAGGTSIARDASARGGDTSSSASQLPSPRPVTTNAGVVSRGEVQQEEVEHETYDDPRAQNTPPPGMRPGVLQDPGPPWSRQSRSDDRIAAVPPPTVSSGPRRGTGEAEVRELKEKVARVMQWPAEKVKEVARRDNFHLSPNLSDLEHGLRPRRPFRGSQEEGEEEEEEEE